jgi:DNA-binding transcriptional MerR regulator
VDKSPDAFRTISEVADDLETPAHVLRFWESRFPQIRPVKRAGGRRYYRPADVALLTGIKRLLHDEGLTIRGVQKILREQGVRHVAGLSGDAVPDDIDMDAEAALEAALASNFGLMDEEDLPPEKAESATIHALETALRRSDARPSESAAEVVPLRAEAETSFNFADLVADASEAESVASDAIAETVLLDTPDQEPKAEPVAQGLPVTAPLAQPEALADPMPEESLAQLQPYATLVERLQALPLDAFANRQAEVHALRARLVALRRRIRRAPEISLS